MIGEDRGQRSSSIWPPVMLNAGGFFSCAHNASRTLVVGLRFEPAVRVRWITGRVLFRRPGTGIRRRRTGSTARLNSSSVVAPRRAIDPSIANSTSTVLSRPFSRFRASPASYSTARSSASWKLARSITSTLSGVLRLLSGSSYLD